MIRELMIINQSGIALFYHSFINNENVDDEQSLASYFDIICKFTKRSFRESLRTITLDSFIFFFYTHSSRYHLVLKCDKIELDNELLESISETIIEEFLDLYKDVLINFNGEISNFHSFSEILIDLIDFKTKNRKNYLPTLKP